MLACKSVPALLLCPVQAVMDHVGACRNPTPDLPQQALAHLHLWLLQRQLHLITPATATSTVLNAAMQMLQAASHEAAHLASQGHDMTHFEAACQAARHELDTKAADRAQQHAKSFQLPRLDGTALPCGPGSYRCPRGQLPSESAVRQEGEGLEAARRRAALNLGSLPLPLAVGGGSCTDGRDLAGLLVVLGAAPDEVGRAPEGDVAVQPALCAVENELFQRVGQNLRAGGLMKWGKEEVDALVEVVDKYRSGTAA
jgi:hypothetical protein